MRTLLASAVALGAFTSVALAEPLALSDVQMDAFTAGQNTVDQSNSLTASLTQSNTSTIEGSENSVTQANTAELMSSQSNSSTISPPPAPAP